MNNRNTRPKNWNSRKHATRREKETGVRISREEIDEARRKFYRKGGGVTRLESKKEGDTLKPYLSPKIKSGIVESFF